MTRVDATSPQGETGEPQPVPITHPAWCDRSRCTVEACAGTDKAGSHLSADLKGPDLYTYTDVPVSLRQTIYNEDGFNTAVLTVGEHSLILAPDSPLLWAIVDEHAQIKKVLSPEYFRMCRARSREHLQAAKEARS